MYISSQRVIIITSTKQKVVIMKNLIQDVLGSIILALAIGLPFALYFAFVMQK